MYENASRQTRLGRTLRSLARMVAGLEITPRSSDTFASAKAKKINVAIIGAGRIGVMLADELQKNPRSSYEPCCFVDVDKSKIGRKRTPASRRGSFERQITRAGACGSCRGR